MSSPKFKVEIDTLLPLGAHFTLKRLVTAQGGDPARSRWEPVAELSTKSGKVPTPQAVAAEARRRIEHLLKLEALEADANALLNEEGA